MNTWWYIDTVTLYQLSCRWTRDDIYILQLYINFSSDEHLIIYTYRNFITTLLQMNTWWYIHTATLYQLSCRWTRDDIYIPQLCMNFPADEHLMIYTYRIFISTFLQMKTWWYIHTATLYQLSCWWTPGDIYIPQLYINFPVDEHRMIYRYRNFISTFLQMNTWWYIHTVTLHQLSCRWTPYDIYITQLYTNFPADEHVMIYTYRNFVSTFLLMNTWWYIHTASFYQLSCRWGPDDIYIPNFISTFLLMNTWWYIHTETLYQLSWRWTPDDIYIP